MLLTGLSLAQTNMVCIKGSMYFCQYSHKDSDERFSIIKTFLGLVQLTPT